MQELQKTLDLLYATKIEDYQFDLLNRKLCLRCTAPEENMVYNILFFGVSFFAGVDIDGERFNASENLENSWLECTEILAIGDKAKCKTRGEFSSQFPGSSIAANLVIDIWGCLYLYIRAKGIMINGQEFLL